MDSSHTIVYFRTLAVVAIILLWGICLLNGTVKELLRAVWNGHLGQGGDSLKTDYTGIPIIDYPIALLVAFFFYGTNGSDEGYQLFLVDAYSTLQSAFVWLYIENLRPGRRPAWIDRPIVFGALWQCFGAAISLPLYYAIHLQWTNDTKVVRAVDLNKSRALPIAFLVGAILPALIGMAPTWLGPDARSVEAHQIILAVWQADPLWVSWTLVSSAGTFSWLDGKNTTTHHMKQTTYWWVRRSYLLAALSSALGHLYVMGSILKSHNPAVNLQRMYVPFPFSGPTGTEDNIFVRGPWLFLQYDLIIISLSSLSWAYLLTIQTPISQRLSGTGLVLAFLAGFLTIGPGATVSLALFIREGQLAEYHMD